MHNENSKIQTIYLFRKEVWSYVFTTFKKLLSFPSGTTCQSRPYIKHFELGTVYLTYIYIYVPELNKFDTYLESDHNWL